MKISDSFRAHFLREILAPLVLVLLITSLGAGYAVYWATSKSNAEAAARQHHIIQTSLSQSLSEMIIQHRSLALWQPLARHVQHTPPDQAWLDQNVGAWLSGMFGHQRVYILRPDGQPVYQWENGRSVRPDGATPVTPAVAAALTGLSHAVASLKTRRESVGFALIDNRPAALAVGTIDGDPAQPRRFVLVSIRYLDGAFLDALSQRSQLQGLYYADKAPLRHLTANYPLISPAGYPLGYLAWQADRPGTRMLGIIAPLVVAVLLIITLICTMMIRRIWLSSLRLSQSLLQLSASEAQAQHLAFHDVLTGLPNRALVEERLAQTLGRRMRDPDGDKVALLLLDLDRFKLVNDTYGHHAGDDLIIEVAHRLTQRVGEKDTVGRLGGDEFVVILSAVATSAEVERLCEQIVEDLSRPFILLGCETWIGVSIGVMLVSGEHTDRAEIVRKADIALYQAKSQGRGQYQFFDPSMDESIKTRLQVATDLRQALLHKQNLAVYYQPQMDISGQKVVGLEALIRWNHPVLGAIPPSEFIPLAEEMGLIIQLGEWVLREACRVSLAWPDLVIAVNVSPLQFRSPGFVEHFEAIVKQENTLPSRIELEITEGVLIEDSKGAKKIMSRLREVGFHIALDDFGTGYSSLNYLSHFSVDKIKIDRSFTQALGVTENSMAIIESVVRLGQAMGLVVTAEGVETSSQMAALAEAGCNQLQGYLFSQAVPEGQIATLLAREEA
ncbi:bifunctional diguanylate cyclase/phosphodiesterase [Erwinia sp. ErVv1]|uniref:putative bifunctional diguanylate cyclase/phosphodiesterase n=1 Tax=Erwinia sp. ErVv1 TaxID=1603299 RepID=UPI0008315090|nr:EAL domain-containing protein [Erwinia sp. ErVv1]